MTKFVDPFVLPVDQYRRCINPLGDYKADAVRYLMLISGDDEASCTQAVERMLAKGGEFEFKDPKVEYFERGESRDRERKVSSALRYIGESIKSEDIIAPTFTTYMPAKRKRSILSIDVDEKIRLRSVAKKAMFKARAQGDTFHANFYKNEQTQRKRSNNSLSGAANSTGTPLANKTSHSSLTSTCRITSGYGNANNEKLLSGNRHYYRHDLVINNIISIIGHTDYVALSAVVDKYALRVPTVDEVMSCITYSTDLYWKSSLWLEQIRTLVQKLNGLQRAAFVYTGDLHQVRILNPDFMKVFLAQLCKRCDCDDLPGALDIIKSAMDSHINLAHQICSDCVKGRGKEYDKMSHTELSTIAATLNNIAQVVMKYADFIKVIMVSPNMPTNVGQFPHSTRRSAVTSDTDSTIFTVQDWISWYTGGEYFTPEGIAIQAGMTFLASSAITHLLAMMSANIGVERDKLFRIQMKSEFRFDVFVPTGVAKTYFASIACQEGAVFEHNELEIKGVMLKNSNNPADINEQTSDMIERIMETVRAGKKIRLLDYIREVAAVEQRIMASVLKGETHYLKSLNINSDEAYSADPEDSPFQNHLFWEQTFQGSYGVIKPPPYKTSKISLTLKNAQSIKKWLDEMEDKALAERLRAYLLKKNKTSYLTFYAPEEVLDKAGVPKEIACVVDVRKIASQLCKSFYLILETLGVYIHQKDLRRLASDLLQEST